MSGRKLHPWDLAWGRRLKRPHGGNPEAPPVALDRGVNYFVLQLERLGAAVRFSCEGYPGDFYIFFEGGYELAVAIHQAGYFRIEVAGENEWYLSFAVEVRSTRARRNAQSGGYRLGGVFRQGVFRAGRGEVSRL